MDNKSDRKLEIYYIDLKLICSIGYCIVPSHIEKKKKRNPPHLILVTLLCLKIHKFVSITV